MRTINKSQFVCRKCGKSFEDYKSNRIDKNVFCNVICAGSFRKGIPSWNLGKQGIYSEATREKMRRAKLGHIPWNFGKTKEIDPRIAQPWLGKTGFVKEKNPNWQGGVTELNWSLRHTTEYLAWRKRILNRDKRLCQLCGKTGNTVDHITPFSRFPELRLDMNNGRVLCVPCHKDTPTYGGRALKI